MTAEINLKAFDAQSDARFARIAWIQRASLAVALAGFALAAYLIIPQL